MARSMFRGGSLVRMPESSLKKVKKGTLMPAWWKTPAEANCRMSQTSASFSCPAALMIMDLLTKPLKSGKAEMEAAPIMQNRQVRGMVL